MKKEFLYAAITDAQETIRFTDTKTVFVASIIAAYIATIYSLIENIDKYSIYFDCLFRFLLFLTSTLIIICLVIIARIIRPTHNPSDNIDPPQSNVRLDFYLPKNEYKGFRKITYPFWNSAAFKLTKTLDDYILQIDLADEKTIERTLSFELLKLNFIRNIKIDRFNILFNFLLITSFSFLCFYLHYSNELLIIKNTCHCCK
jgi:hypothetical protein